MQFARHGWKLGCWSAVVAIIVGCGTQSAPLAEVDINDSSVAGSTEQSNGLPLLAVPGPDDATNNGKATRAATTSKSGPTLLPKGLFGKKPAQPEPLADDGAGAKKVLEKGSPEWLLNEIQLVRLLPLPHEEIQARPKSAISRIRSILPSPDGDDDDEDEEEDQPLTPAQEKKLTQEIERNKGIRRERNLQIVKLAEECIQKTNKNPEQEPIFCTAVHHLLDARLQLALQGDSTSIDALYEADKVFFERNPQSESSSESALTLVNFTHANALRYGRQDPRWLKEFSKQTQSYSLRFPAEMARTAPLLMAAARTCEMNGQPEEARVCYTVLASKLKETPQGQLAANIVKRLQLKGQVLELAGPGIDGGDIDVKSLKGKMVLVVFWASNAQPFVQQLPKLMEITSRYRKYVSVVGVNLDTDEKVVDEFVETHHLEWPQIFSPNRQQRGWSSPAAIHFGVNTLPTIWLLDPNGVVAEMNLDASNLEAKIKEVHYAQPRAKSASAK